jgi:hypothetical protein
MSINTGGKMTHSECSESWIATGDVISLQSRVREFFKKHQMRIIGEQAGEVHARQGSVLLTQIFGARLALSRWLPKLAFVKLKNADKGVTVRAAIGNGEAQTDLSPRLRAKYDAYFELWMKGLKSQIGEMAP